MVASSPDRMFQELTGPTREAFVMFLWQEAAKECNGPAIPHVSTEPLVPGQLPGMTKLDVLGRSFVCDKEIVFISMPAALEPNEALFVAPMRDPSGVRTYFYERCTG